MHTREMTVDYNTNLVHIPHTDNVWIDPSIIVGIDKQYAPANQYGTVFVIFYLTRKTAPTHFSKGWETGDEQPMSIGRWFAEPWQADEAIAAVTPQPITDVD